MDVRFRFDWLVVVPKIVCIYQTFLENFCHRYVWVYVCIFLMLGCLDEIKRMLHMHDDWQYQQNRSLLIRSMIDGSIKDAASFAILSHASKKCVSDRSIGKEGCV